MWDPDYDKRLKSWYDLRQQSFVSDLETSLLRINDWWWQAPMVNRSLQWQNFPNWPDPWQLLSQSGFCDLARALGMLYTVTMLNRDVGTVCLAQIPGNNLVLIDSKKYILNWNLGTIVNNLSSQTVIQRAIDSSTLIKSIR